MLRNEEKEFQIELAELQADVQIYLSLSITFVGVLVTYLIGLEQIYFSRTSGLDSVGISIIIAIFAGIVIIGYALYTFLGKADKARRKISDLRKKYVW